MRYHPAVQTRNHLSPGRSASALAAGCACLMSGCAGTTSLTVESERSALTPTIQTAVYGFTDSNTADIYLSDLPPEDLVARLAQGVEGEPGVVLHLHVFLAPKAGRTPIDFTASNASVTLLVLNGAARGVYGGGGFMLPSSSLGGATIAGEMRQATIRLVESDAGFGDALGLAEVSGDIAARRDDALAARISDEMTRLLLE